jgi:hypothetical protein
MPRGDRTGPMRSDPMTGRGAGYCGGFGEPGFMNPTGRGSRGGRRRWFHATGLSGWARADSGLPAWGTAHPCASPATPGVTGEVSLTSLKAHAGHLEQMLQSLRQHIQNLEDAAKSE